MSVFRKIRQALRPKPKVVELEPKEVVCEYVGDTVSNLTPQTIVSLDEPEPVDDRKSLPEIPLVFEFVSRETAIQVLRTSHLEEVGEIFGAMIQYGMMLEYRGAKELADQVLPGQPGEHEVEKIHRMGDLVLWTYLQDLRALVGRRTETSPPALLQDRPDLSLSA